MRDLGIAAEIRHVLYRAARADAVVPEGTDRRKRVSSLSNCTVHAAALDLRSAAAAS